MLFYKNFDAICRSRGTSANAAALAIGRSKSAASAWKRNGTLPKEEELIALADHLNCYVSDFFRQPGEPWSAFAQMMDGVPLGEPIKLPKDEEAPLDDYEMDLLSIYDSLSPKDRLSLMSHAYELAEQKGITV